MAVLVSAICRSFCRRHGITSSYLSISYQQNGSDITHNLPIFLPLGRFKRQKAKDGQFTTR
jgi:hypothetical protein